MKTSIYVFKGAASPEPAARGSDRAAAGGELRHISVGTKRSINDISNAEIWTKDFWKSTFERLSLDMKRHSVMAKAIHPFLTMITNQIRQAHSDHHERPTGSSFNNFQEKHAFVLYLRRVIWIHEYTGHITRAQEVEMQQMLEYDFDMNTSISVSSGAASLEPTADGSDRAAADGESRHLSVGTKQWIDDISDAEIWTKDFWKSTFERLSLDMKRDSVMAKAIHPFLIMIKNQIRQAHSDHHERPTLSSFKNFEEKHAFVLYLRRVIGIHEGNGHITRAQEVEMQQILQYDFD